MTVYVVMWSDGSGSYISSVWFSEVDARAEAARQNSEPGDGLCAVEGWEVKSAMSVPMATGPIGSTEDMNMALVDFEERCRVVVDTQEEE